jgi:hypothetical protein
MENDSSRQQSCDLFKDDHLPIAFHTDNILLVFLGRSLVHRVQEFSPPITHFAYYARNRGSVHVNIKNAQENADASLFPAANGNPGNICNFSIRRRDDGTGRVGNDALWIAKEPQEK